MELTEREIKLIIEKVIKNVENNINNDSFSRDKMEALSSGYVSNNAGLPSENEEFGIYEDVVKALNNTHEAFTIYNDTFSMEDRTKIINSIRNKIMLNIDMLSNLIFEETKLGRLEDKASKIELSAMKTPGIEDLHTQALSGDFGLTLEERAPFGLIGAVTPVTNPVETIVSNTISMLAAGNSVIFNVHPSAKKSSAQAVILINEAILEVGGPKSLVTMVKEPSMESLKTIMNCPKVTMLVGTGGAGLVKSLLQSGKKVVGAGAGNPPVIVDETANIKHAAKSIVDGASFDNNLLCIAEKTLFVHEDIYENFIFELMENNAYFLNNGEADKVKELIITSNKEVAAKGCSVRDIPLNYHINKKWIGQDASKILGEIGVNKNFKLLVYEAQFEDPLVHLEQMIPVLPIVKYKNFDEAVKFARTVEGGNRHTASIFSQNINNMTKFAKEIQTTIFVKNEATLAGVGFKGEGHTTFTIAGPTGEGVTSAKTFTRIRRCVLAGEGIRIV